MHGGNGEGLGRHHQHADVPARPPRHQLSAPGSFGLPQAHGGRQPDGDPGNPAHEPARAPRAHEPADRAAGPRNGAPQQRLHAFGRRAAARGDRALAGDRAQFPAAGRAVFRHRSHPGAGAAAHHFRSEELRHRHPGHRPQRARDAGGDRSRLHHQQRQNLPRGTPEALGTDPEVRRVYLGENFNMEFETSRWKILADQ